VKRHYKDMADGAKRYGPLDAVGRALTLIFMIMLIPDTKRGGSTAVIVATAASSIAAILWPSRYCSGRTCSASKCTGSSC